jgi:hypothetical protein
MNDSDRDKIRPNPKFQASNDKYTVCHNNLPKKGWRHKCCSKKTFRNRNVFLTTTININFKFLMTKTWVWILNFGHYDLPFDGAQGGELVEPFEICDL